MGIDVDAFSEFIIRILKSQARIMPSREKYEIAINAAKERKEKYRYV